MTSESSCRFEERELRLLKCAIQFFYRHIRFDESTVSRMSENDIFQLFDERSYHVRRKGRVDSVLIDSVYETTETHVSTLILSILHQGLFSVTSLIIAIIYLSRLKEATRVSLHTYSWRLLFLTSLLVADKANEDKPIQNGSLVRLFPILTAAELNDLELTLLVNVRFSIHVRPSLFESFLDKLELETVSIEVNDLVDNSEFAAHNFLPSISTLPCTPEPLYAYAMGKVSRSTTPVTAYPTSAYRNTTPRRLSSQTVAPVRIEAQSNGFPRGRSPSLSRKVSSSYMDDSLEYSRASSRRRSNSRPAHVPPPPIFEPIRHHHHSRRPSIGGRRDSYFDGAGAIQNFHAMASRMPSPRSNSFINIAGGRPGPVASVSRWNNLF